MGVFSAPPKSFKVDRKSEFASIVKSLIVDQLLHLCPDFADDVLAEYITVLVCNGKNQNQARDDLEAFLGGKSQEFVSWLWRFLLKNELQLTTVLSSDRKDKTSSNHHDTYEENGKKVGKSGDLQDDNSMGEEEEIHSAKSYKSHDTVRVDDHHSLRLTDTMTRSARSTSPQSKPANSESSIDVPPSVEKYQTGSVDKSKKPAYFPGRRPASLPDRSTAPRTHSSHGDKLSEHPHLHYTEHPLKRSLSPLPLVDTKPKQSVWDRLGKPQKYVPSRGHTEEWNSKEWIDQRPLLIARHGEQLGHLSPLLRGPTDQDGRRLREVHKDDRANKIDDSSFHKTIPQGPSASNIKRKRHFGHISCQPDSATAVGNSADNQSEHISQVRRRPEILLEASRVVPSQVQDVKQRLRHIEIEMAKLKSKQIEMGKGGKTNLLTNSGVVKPAEEEIESRTILVTNVHHKATNETLSLFFRKCGAVVSVVILNDGIPLAPQRSAYITFESKESADKALGFNGTSFYSRIITVSRKGEIAGLLSSEPPQFARSKSNERFPCPPGSRLQWRRESLLATQSEHFPASGSDQTTEAPKSVAKAAEDSRQMSPLISTS